MNWTILADASLPDLEKRFPAPFQLMTYATLQQLEEGLLSAEILLCRSTLKVDAQRLQHTPVQCVATASSGTDHIDINYLQQHNIHLFDAKGSNARAVADYVLASLAFLQTNQLLRGKQAGIVGVGAVGSLVVQQLLALGFEVHCIDPDKHPTTHPYDKLGQCDLICLHANLHNTPPHPSQNLFNASLLAQLKPGVCLINASRGGIVNEPDLLATHTPITYCTDVYEHEPTVRKALVDYATLCTPHIAGHTIDAKHNAIFQLSHKIHQHYHLPFTQHPYHSPAPQPPITLNALWPQHLLARFNPIEETQQLKQALNPSAVFLTLRKAHTRRHDLSYT